MVDCITDERGGQAGEALHAPQRHNNIEFVLVPENIDFASLELRFSGRTE